MSQVKQVIEVASAIGGAIFGAKELYDFATGADPASDIRDQAQIQRDEEWTRSANERLRAGMQNYLHSLEAVAPSYVLANRERLQEGYREWEKADREERENLQT